MNRHVKVKLWGLAQILLQWQCRHSVTAYGSLKMMNLPYRVSCHATKFMQAPQISTNGGNYSYTVEVFFLRVSDGIWSSHLHDSPLTNCIYRVQV